MSVQSPYSICSAVPPSKIPDGPRVKRNYTLFATDHLVLLGLWIKSKACTVICPKRPRPLEDNDTASRPACPTSHLRLGSAAILGQGWIFVLELDRKYASRASNVDRDGFSKLLDGRFAMIKVGLGGPDSHHPLHFCC